MYIIRTLGLLLFFVGVVGHAMQLVGNHTHFCVIQENRTQLCLMQFLDCYWYNSFFELHSNVCDYLCLQILGKFMMIYQH